MKRKFREVPGFPKGHGASGEPAQPLPSPAPGSRRPTCTTPQQAVPAQTLLNTLLLFFSFFKYQRKYMLPPLPPKKRGTHWVAFQLQVFHQPKLYSHFLNTQHPGSRAHFFTFLVTLPHGGEVFRKSRSPTQPPAKSRPRFHSSKGGRHGSSPHRRQCADEAGNGANFKAPPKSPFRVKVNLTGH